MRSFLTSLYTLQIAGLLFLVSAGCEPAVTPPAPVSSPPVNRDKVLSAQLFARHNEVRRLNNVSTVEVSPLLVIAAQGHADWMAENRHMTHVGKDDSSFGQRVQATGYNLKTGGENIIGGYDTVDAVMDACLQSPGQRQNILNGAYRQIGLGLSTDKEGRYYWCVILGTPWGITDNQIQPRGLAEPNPLSPL